MKMKALSVNNRKFRVNDGGAIRYDEGQNLTEEEKAQARKNIGAENTALDVLFACNLVPAVTNDNGEILAEADGTILLNL